MSNDERLLNDAVNVGYRTLVGNLRPIDPPAGSKLLSFELIRSSRNYYKVFVNEERIASGPSRWKFLNFFDGLFRVTVGEHAPELVFIHAGVVSWKGRVILLPGHSFSGKSTLVTELVKIGAEYYSDEFALADKNGLIHPFPRHINRRADDGKNTPYEIDPRDIEAKIGTSPKPCGLVLFTKFRKGSRFSPMSVSKGDCVLNLINFALPIRVNPEFTLRVLNKMVNNAILLESHRPSAEKTAKKILQIVDNLGG
jgi:hypothetical protein